MKSFNEQKPIPEVVPPERVPENPQPEPPKINPAEDPKVPEQPHETPVWEPLPEYEPDKNG